MSALLEQQTVEMTQIFCSEFISSQLSGPNFDKAFANGFLALLKPTNLPPVRTTVFINNLTEGVSVGGGGGAVAPSVVIVDALQPHFRNANWRFVTGHGCVPV